MPIRTATRRVKLITGITMDKPKAKRGRKKKDAVEALLEEVKDEKIEIVSEEAGQVLVTEYTKNILEAELDNDEFLQVDEEIFGNLQEEEPVIIEEVKPKRERDKYHFRAIKSYEGFINQDLLNSIASDQERLKEIAETHVDTLDDDALFDFGKPLYPNIKPIKDVQDREVVLKMIRMGDPMYLAAGGWGLLEYLVKNYRHLGLVLKNNVEIVGIYGIKHINALCGSIEIMLGGGFKQKAKTAKEMVLYFGSKYAEMAAQQGYRYLSTITLTPKHASLLKKVTEKECKIKEESLKLEAPEMEEKELKQKAFKLAPGFKTTGSIVPRPFEGRIVWETHWRYDLGAKFSEHFQRQ